MSSKIKAAAFFVSWLPLWLLLLLLFLGLARSQQGDHVSPSIQDVVVDSPVLVRALSSPFLDSSPGVKADELVTCTRFRIPGISRLRNIKKYAHSYRVKVQASSDVCKTSVSKIDVCFHGNESLGVGQCSKDNWRSVDKGSWTGMMSPFETRFIDIRTRVSFTDAPFTVSVVEEFWAFRLAFLVLGTMLWLVAPVISSWVPFYYSSAMTLGIFLVVLILLYQGMKLLPMGRKSTLYIILYGSLVGMGTMIMHYFMGLVSSIRSELGFKEDMYNPVALFVLVGVALMGAWLGYWGVRKLVLSEDGTIDVGTAEFVKWAIRLIGMVMILQSSHDVLFALFALVATVTIAWAIRKTHPWDLDLWDIFLSVREYFSSTSRYLIPRKDNRKAYVNHARAEFLRKSDSVLLKSQATSLHQKTVSSPRGLFGASPASSPSKPSPDDDFFSTFHRAPGRKPLTKPEWDGLTKECTKKAVSDLVASPKFAEWVVNHTDRIMIVPNEPREERSKEEIQMTADMVQIDDEKLSRRPFCW